MHPAAASLVTHSTQIISSHFLRAAGLSRVTVKPSVPIAIAKRERNEPEVTTMAARGPG